MLLLYIYIYLFRSYIALLINLFITIKAFTRYNIYNKLKRRLFNNINLAPTTRFENNKLIKLYYFNNFFSIFST